MNIGEEILGINDSGQEVNVPILGLHNYKSTGHIIVYGDSNCLDNNHLEIGIFVKKKNIYIYHFYSYNYNYL